MTPFQKIILITIVLGVLVTIFYAFVVKFYYWGERGKPLPSAESRRRKQDRNNPPKNAPPEQ